MSKKDKSILYAELLLERKENYPPLKEIINATVLCKNERGLILDINKTFEAYVSKQELGAQKLEEYKVGDKVEVILLSDKDNTPDGLFKASVKELDTIKHWTKLEELKGQDLELSISKVLKSGVEVLITETQQTGFVPHRYLDAHYGELKGYDREQWNGRKIQGRIHELDQSKNKIIIDSKVITNIKKKQEAEALIQGLELGQTIKGTVVRTVDFGVFVDIGGIDALVPASEISYQRFNKPSDIIKIGEVVEAKIFRIDAEERKVGLSIKQTQASPWQSLPAEIKIGHSFKAKVITHADFGVFVEVLPGVEALLHKSNIATGEEFPALGSQINVTIANLDPDKKRMGVNLQKETTSEIVEVEKVASETIEKANEIIEAATDSINEEAKAEEQKKEVEHVQ